MRFALLSLSAFLLSSCAHTTPNRDDLALDQVLQAFTVIVHPEAVERRGGRVMLAAQPDLARMADLLGVERGNRVEWGLRCHVDPQFRLFACEVYGASSTIADKASVVTDFLNGLTIMPTETALPDGVLEFDGQFRLRNAVSAPDYWREPCDSRFFCPVIHTYDNFSPPPPPPPPAAPQ